jgi:hypothetical protein
MQTLQVSMLTQLLKSTFYMNIFKRSNLRRERYAKFSEVIFLEVFRSSI